MVRRGQSVVAGRTENTIIDPAVRKKLFYPGMEKRALNEALRALRIMYTIHSKGPGPLRMRFGYQPIGRWVVYLPKVGAASLQALLRRGQKALPVKVPDALLRLMAALTVRASGSGARAGGGPRPLEVEEVVDIDALGAEYEQLWNAARLQYDLTIDRSLEFLRWRTTENPNLGFRTWALRRGGRLHAVVIGHPYRVGGGATLYIDDLIVGSYEETSFDAVVATLSDLDPQSDTVVLMTLAVDTPLYRVLRKRLRLQTFLLDRFGPKLFDELLALDQDNVAGDRPWYVTPIFTEGLDTSREGLRPT